MLGTNPHLYAAPRRSDAMRLALLIERRTEVETRRDAYRFFACVVFFSVSTLIVVSFFTIVVSLTGVVTVVVSVAAAR